MYVFVSKSITPNSSYELSKFITELVHVLTIARGQHKF